MTAPVPLGVYRQKRGARSWIVESETSYDMAARERPRVRALDGSGRTRLLADGVPGSWVLVHTRVPEAVAGLRDLVARIMIESVDTWDSRVSTSAEVTDAVNAHIRDHVDVAAMGIAGLTAKGVYRHSRLAATMHLVIETGPPMIRRDRHGSNNFRVFVGDIRANGLVAMRNAIDEQRH